MQVEIWSDIACPWCYVGKRRFEAALAAFEHRDEVTVTWRSFELDPQAPTVRTVDSATHLAEQYGMTREQAQSTREARRGRGARRPRHALRPRARGQHFDGHRLVHLAEAHGLQDAMTERLMRAQGLRHRGRAHRRRGRRSPRVALEVGLAEDEVRDVLAGHALRGRGPARTSAPQMSLGIHAVPFIAVDRRIGAAGARPPEALGELLRQARTAELRS